METKRTETEILVLLVYHPETGKILRQAAESKGLPEHVQEAVRFRVIPAAEVVQDRIALKTGQLQGRTVPRLE